MVFIMYTPPPIFRLSAFQKKESRKGMPASEKEKSLKLHFVGSNNQLETNSCFRFLSSRFQKSNTEGIMVVSKDSEQRHKTCECGDCSSKKEKAFDSA
jgi:hypothetical protein